MNRRRKKSVIAVMAVLYIAAAGILLYHIHPQVQALGKKTVTLDIGAGGDSVSAVLTEKGILTISGTGRTKDYTEENAPFQEYGDRVTSVVIQEGITGIGDCLFYNCGNLKGNLVLPSTVIWIGDRAFGGSDYETAPKFASVTSKFTSADIAIARAGEMLPEVNPTETDIASPGNAAGPADASKENPDPVKPSEATPSEPAPSESIPSEPDGETTATKASEAETENPAGTETEISETEEDPEEERETSEEAKPEEPSPSMEQETFTQMSAGTRKTPAFFKSIAGAAGKLAAEPETVSVKPEKPQPEGQGNRTESEEGSQTAGNQTNHTASDKNNPVAGNQAKQTASDQNSQTAGNQTKQTASDQNNQAAENQNNQTDSEPTPSLPTAGNQNDKTDSSSTETSAQEERETSGEAPEETEEDSEEGLLENDLYSGAVELSRIDQAMLPHYTVRTITSQIVGEEIFYPGQYGAYSADEANTAFTDASEAAGYRKAQRFIGVNMEGIESTVPVVDGAFYAPDLPAELEIPGDSDDPLFYESFAGWTTEYDWETMGEEAPSYAPGTAVLVSDDITGIKLYANWDKTCALDPMVSVQPGENVTVYQLVNGETGEAISEPEGYQIGYQWQICAPAIRPETEGEPLEDEEETPEAETPEAEIPASETLSELSASDPSDESSWQDIEGANDSMYSREAGKEDELSYFRVKIEIEKRTYFRSASEPVILYSAAAVGNYTLKSITVVYAPGDGAGGTGPEPDTVLDGEVFVPKNNTFTRTNSSDSKVFSGWKTAYSGVVLKKPSGTVIGADTTLPVNCTSMVLEAAAGEVTPTMTLTAQWSDSTTIYVDQTNGNDTANDGRTESTPVKSIKKAYELLPSGGSAETNIIQLLSNYNLKDNYMENQSTLRNVTICGKGYDNTVLNMNTESKLQGDTTLRDVRATVQYLACNAYNFVVESNAGIGGTSLLGDYDGYVFGAPADCTNSHIMARNNDRNPGTFGTKGTTPDNPTVIRLMGANSNIARVMGGSRVPADHYTSEENPFYVDITVDDGYIGVVASGSVYAGTDYINADVHINGGRVASVVGGQHYSGAVATLYGTYRVFVNGGKITNLCGGPEGRTDSVHSRSYITSQLEIFGGEIENVYGGGTTGKFEGTVNIDVNGGEIQNFYGGGYGYSKYVDRYYNDTATLVGTVTANINGGRILGNVYAGGRGSWNGGRTGSAVITGDTYLNITGGEIGGDVFGGGGGITQDATAAKITGTSTIRVTGGTIVGNVYGGGDLASIGGQAILSISGNPSIGGNIYGGGNTSGTVGSTDITVNAPFGAAAGNQSVYGGGNGSATKVSGTSKVTVASSADITGNVFGGGEMGSAASTQLQLLSGGTVHGNVYGGGNAAAVNGTVAINALSGSQITGDLYGGSNSSGTISGQITINSAGAVRNIFGAGNGSATKADSGTQITVQNGAAVSENVYGGGEQGTVTRTKVILSGGTVTGSVFGGGNRVGTSHAAITLTGGPTVTGNIYGGSNMEGETEVSEITVEGTRSDDIYGGGWGELTTVTTSNVTAQAGSVINGAIFGGGLKGQVKKSNVLLKANSQVAKAFGGGSDADVTEASLVTVEYGGKAENIYGGSNNSGTVKGAVVTIYGEVENAYGAGKGAGTITEAPRIIAENGSKVTSLYGGGQEGQTIVTSTVTLKSGSFVTSAFGGGNAAGVTGTAAGVTGTAAKVTGTAAGVASTATGVTGTATGVTGTAAGVTGTAAGVTGTAAEVTGAAAVSTTADSLLAGTGVATVHMESGAKAVNLYGGSNSKGTVDKTVVTVSGTLGDASNGIEGAVYGGGLGRDTSTGTTQVTIESTGSVFGGTDKGVFGGGAKGLVTGDTAVTLNAVTNITGNVYAGGDEAIVKGSTELRLNDGTEMTGSLFGGGKGVTAEIETDTRVIVFAKITGNVFGGGALGPVKGNTHVDIAKGTVTGDGDSTGNVFGGSDQAKVSGNTLVHIGKEAAQGLDIPVDGVSLTIEGTVFGGGNTTDSGKAFDSTTPFVLGNSNVSVDATGYDTAKFNIAKSIFGDGNMCTVKGDRNVFLKNYKALGDQANASIQRATKLTLDSCQVELSGAKDSANLVPTIPYSLNRIDDLILKGGSTLKIRNSVNLVKKLESLSSSGTPVTTTSTEDTGVEPSTKNCIYIKQGYNLELRTSEDVTTPEYGSVSGYTILGSYDETGAKIENGVYIQGDYHAEAAAGGFLSAETESLYRWIKPSTDNKTWRIWALGTNMTRNGVLVMSNKPAGEKVYQFDSPWPADGSIYRFDPAIEITAADSYGGADFIVKTPEAIQAPDAPDTTLGLSVKTGSIGWLNQADTAYIEGSSAAGSDNHFDNLSSQKMQTINNRSIKPQFRVELTNLPGISEVDSGYPLTVQFKMQNIKENPDGTETPQGTLTVILKINRNGSLTYEDILLATGKEYERASQTYTFNQQSVSNGATVTQGSAVTLQYAKKEDQDTTGGYGVSDHKLTFTTWESGSEAPALMPQGATILAVDRAGSADAPAYYHYTVPAGGVSEVLLSKFVKNGTANEYYKRTFGVNEAENFLFILDFGGAPSFTQEKLCVAFVPVYQGGTTTAKPAKIVFAVSGSPKTYQLTSADMTGETGEGKPYERDGVIPVSLTVSATATVGVDTTGTDLKVGARYRLKNRSAGTYVSIPSGWLMNGEVKDFNRQGDHLDVLLGNNMTEMTVGTEIAMKESSLPAGNYQWEIHLLSAPLVNYPGSPAGAPIYVNFSLTDKRYSILTDAADPSEKRLYEAEAAAADRKPMAYTIQLKAANGAATEDVSRKVSLWKKNETTGTYEILNMESLFTDATGAAMSYSWSDHDTISYTLKPSISPGTYRLRFELVKSADGGDQLLTYDTENFIVIP